MGADAWRMLLRCLFALLPQIGDGKIHEGTSVRIWRAHVDDRFAVWSHHRELLIQSLARTGVLADLLRPFPAVQALPDDADHVVCALPRRDDQAYWGRPLPIEPTVTCFRSEPWRLLVLHGQPLPQQYADTARALGPTTTTVPDGPWLMTVNVQQSSGDDVMRSLVAELLFGLAIFI